ncbi:small ubiquitin-related modifier 1-like [Vicia villosa]|uniref:small ubiquitin-related modifier 1-like n=1 Tax=Vicia villosa TaxID=3911 RepID=UPI00273BB483|nr:small ubiquitin-related modifier 1-like [Vicia villosa]XP_058763623.1 small ubiquitin-related modifier 1-like [Vicia villosa]
MSNMASNDDTLASKGNTSVKAEDDGIVYVKISIRGLDGRELFFKVNQDTFLERAFRKYCEVMELEYDTMHFMLDDGERIRGERQTPKMLNIENGTEIVAAKPQTGGGSSTL